MAARPKSLRFDARLTYDGGPLRDLRRDETRELVCPGYDDFGPLRGERLASIRRRDAVDPYVRRSGRDRATATSCLTVFAGTAGCVTRRYAVVPTRETGAKLVSGS